MSVTLLSTSHGFSYSKEPCTYGTTPFGRTQKLRGSQLVNGSVGIRTQMYPATKNVYSSKLGYLPTSRKKTEI